MKRILLVLVLSLYPIVAHAQAFDSGSTGADGPFSCSNTNLSRQVPDSGIFNFTTVTISSCSLTFIPNQRNTPVIILATEDVVINGNILVDAGLGSSVFTRPVPGPGGFYGGAADQPGFGPGGGAPGQPGQWIGPLSLVPTIGGSGGGGSTTQPGGGGGGAIVIASSTSIQCAGGSIRARGAGASGNSGVGPGAGGSIRLVANSVTGACALDALGGASGTSLGGNAANAGIIRIEAPSVNYTGTPTPSVVTTLAVNPQIIPTSTTASLTVASIGGFPVLSDAGSRPGTVDVVLPRALTDPIALVVQASKIPVGTAVSLSLSGSTGATYTSGTLTGSFDQSTATLQVSGLNRTAETHLFVYATFDVPLDQQTAALNPAGPDQVAKMQVRAAPGRPSTMAFLRHDGSEIDPIKLPPKLLAYLNQPSR